MAKMPDISRFLGEQLRDVPNLGTDAELRQLPVADVHPNPANFYPPIERDAMADLMDSIRANGVLEPLLVLQDGDGYRLISGHNRLEAVRKLQAGEPDEQRWHTVPCRVLPPMDEAREKTAIIEANRQRRKTPQVLQQEAEELTRLYTERKKAGEELPGRIRDRVAEALEISAAHLSRLNAIKNGLKIPGFQRMWEQEEIGESVAYEISKLDPDQQYRLLDYHIDSHHPLSLPTIRRFSVICEKLRKGACRVTGGPCENADRMYDAFFHGGEWRGCCGCCACCLKRETCKTVCTYCKPDTPGKEPEKTERFPVLEDPRLHWEAIGKAFCGRLRALREATGLSRKEFAEKMGEYPGTYSAWENASLPGSERIPRLALALGVSTDYLFGLTEEPAQRPALTWRALDDDWPEVGSAVLLCRDNGIGGYEYLPAAYLSEQGNRFPFSDLSDMTDVEDWDSYRWWLPIPEKD